MPSALVTGGAGFIGSHVARCFLQQGYAVTIIDDLSRGRSERVPSGASFHRLDVRSERAAALVRDGRFDVVCHLAAQIDVRKSVANPLEDMQVNVAGTVTLLEAIRASGSTTRFVFSSTGGAIYGSGAPVPTTESAHKLPESPYGASKLSAELYLGHYARAYGVESVILRYSNVFGPDQDAHGEAGVVAIFCERLLSGEPLIVYGDGRQTRDYVFVEDVARANLLAATSDLPPVQRTEGRAFNIGTGAETNVLRLIEELEAISGITADVRHEAERLGEQKRSLLCSERARRHLGWAPTRSLRSNLEATWRHFAEKRSTTAAEWLARLPSTPTREAPATVAG